MRPRIRSIKPEMRHDERYARMSYAARELFNGLITAADDEGRFRALSSAILGHVFPYDEDAPESLKAWVAEVKESGMILFYLAERTPYGAFRHWAKHQKINRPTPSDLPPPPSPKIVKENGLVRSEKGWKQAYRLTDSSMNDHDGLSDSSARPHSPTGECAFRSDLDPVPVLSMPTAELRTLALARRLATYICRNDPKAKPNPETGRWINDMRLLVTDRGGDEDAFLEVERIIDWCQADDFWRSNILSPAKLRKQFTQLSLKSQPGVRLAAVGRRENASDWLRDINGGAA